MPDILVTTSLPTLAAILLAPWIGSLLGVLILRLPAGRPVVIARSACAACGRTLEVAELVPILSYFWLAGRCRCGAAPIGRFHLGIEVAAITVPVSVALAGQSGILLWMGCVLGWVLLALAWIDAETLTLPDALSLPLIPVGLATTWWAAPHALASHAAATVLGYAAFSLLRWSWGRWRRVEGIGAGDAKLLAVAGAWTGLVALPDIVLGAGLAGLLLAGIARLLGRRVGHGTKLPFGPPLALAIWAGWLWVAGSRPGVMHIGI
jgi:leader peptidase (prepilin peptidase) / N-methyltransferase